jgi:hypothetical protein
MPTGDGSTSNKFLTANFQFTRDPLLLTQNLVSLVEQVNAEQEINNSSLEAKLNAALNTLDDLNTNNDIAALNSLNGFIKAVEAQLADGDITDAQAEQLVAAAQAIIDLLTGA